MDNKLIIKIKNALNTNHPIERINEIVDEFDEIQRLIKWRENMLLDGDKLSGNENELNRVTKIIEKSDYYMSICECDIDKEVRKYFSNM